jgi:hypothetical protein
MHVLLAVGIALLAKFVLAKFRCHLGISSLCVYLGILCVAFLRAAVMPFLGRTTALVRGNAIVCLLITFFLPLSWAAFLDTGSGGDADGMLWFWVVGIPTGVLAATHGVLTWHYIKTHPEDGRGDSAGTGERVGPKQ